MHHTFYYPFATVCPIFSHFLQFFLFFTDFFYLNYAHYIYFLFGCHYTCQQTLCFRSKLFQNTFYAFKKGSKLFTKWQIVPILYLILQNNKWFYNTILHIFPLRIHEFNILQNHMFLTTAISILFLFQNWRRRPVFSELTKTEKLIFFRGFSFFPSFFLSTQFFWFFFFFIYLFPEN